MNLPISPWQVVWPRMMLICGLGLIFAPINVAAAYRYTPAHLRGAAVGLFALLRNEGSVGTSINQIIEQRGEQFHLARVGEDLSPLNPQVQSFFESEVKPSSSSRRATRPGRSR